MTNKPKKPRGPARKVGGSTSATDSGKDPKKVAAGKASAEARHGERTPGSGRQAGTPNKRTAHLQRLIDGSTDPFEIVRQIAAGEVENTHVIGKDAAGSPITVKTPLDWRLRLDAAKELMQYLEPKRKAIEHSGLGGGDIPVAVIKRVIVDPKNEAKE